MTDHVSDEQANLVECPWCEAPPGKRCTRRDSVSGQTVETWTHEMRRMDYALAYFNHEVD